MSERLETIVVVTDKGSQTFVKVGNSATQMGTAIDKAGVTGERGLTKISKAGAVTGAALTALSGTLTLAARANSSNAQACRRTSRMAARSMHDEFA